MVCEAELEMLASLLDKSLVRRGDGRVWMLETIREFASEQLAVDPRAHDLRARHARHYLALAEAGDRQLRGPSRPQAMQWFASELDNVRTAMVWLLERDPPSALRLAAELSGFWQARGDFREGRQSLMAALDLAGSEATEAKASALVGAGAMAWGQGDYQEAIRLLGEGLTCARAVAATETEVRALVYLAKDFGLGEEEQIRLGDEAIAIASHGDPGLLGFATGNQGVLMHRSGEHAKARDLTETAYRLSREAGDLHLASNWLSNLAWTDLEAEATAEARERLNESLELSRLIDDPWVIGGATANLGFVELLEGNLDQAFRWLAEAGTIARRLGIRSIGVAVLSGLAYLAAIGANPSFAARLDGAADALGSRDRSSSTGLSALAHHLEEARASLGESAWQRARAEGALLTFDAALELGLGREVRDSAVVS
jgi:tetratricopeptide (TPR) repeat protein